ncbi:MAG: nitroreductase family protein [Bacteroidaceae bacterium]|nr:nitroreductase family protein [Bacteroidaceae bacterium]
MTFSQIYKDIRTRLSLPILFLMETFTYWMRLCRYNASINTDADIRKMQYTLLRENHTIEKGMSIRNTRRGFGQAKVTALIQRLRRYNRMYGSQDKSFLVYPLSTIKAYIAYQHQDKVDIPEIEKLYATLCNEANISSNTIVLPAGIERVLATNLQKEAVGNFSSLLYSRHSIRYFKDEIPSKDLLEQALILSSRTPSACNRQAWHTHIYFGEDSHELLRMQDGCKGFCEDIHCCIVVTADMKGFLGHEPFQCYIDGGLYAQNLINALHYVGLGAIPLSCGFLSKKLYKIQEKINIPKNEVMIVIIGTGVMLDEMKIAISTRKSISSTNTYH